MSGWSEVWGVNFTSVAGLWSDEFPKLELQVIKNDERVLSTLTVEGLYTIFYRGALCAVVLLSWAKTLWLHDVKTQYCACDN